MTNEGDDDIVYDQSSHNTGQLGDHHDDVYDHMDIYDDSNIEGVESESGHNIVSAKVDGRHIIDGKRVRKPVSRFDPSGYLKKVALKISKLSAPKAFRNIGLRPDKAEWYDAYTTEVQSLVEVAGFEVVKRKEVPKDCEVLPLLELFSIKDDGRKKVRLVVRGDLQRNVPENLFSPTANGTTIRTFLAVAASRGWKVRALDIKTAYLYGRTDEKIFVQLPKGHPLAKCGEYVMMSNSSLYGLKQAPRVWNQTLHRFLMEMGFVNCKVDKCLYAYTKGEIVILVYVDDILYSSPEESTLEWFEKYIQTKFSCRIDRDLKKFVGYEIEVTNDGIKIGQEEYVKKMLETFEMSECFGVATPMVPNVEISDPEGEVLKTNKLYRGILGSLLFVNLSTRPDICFAVNRMSSFSEKPTTMQLKHLKRILRYLKENPSKKLYYKRGNIEVSMSCDSSWRNAEDSRSVYGFLVKINGTPVVFRSKVQRGVAMSSSEAEYIGIAESLKELLFIKNIVEFMRVKIPLPMKVMNDNRAAIIVSKNLSSISKMKHLDARYHFVQDYVDSGMIDLVYKKTDELVADIMTKALGRVKFEMFRDALFA